MSKKLFFWSYNWISFALLTYLVSCNGFILNFGSQYEKIPYPTAFTRNFSNIFGGQKLNGNQAASQVNADGGIMATTEQFNNGQQTSETVSFNGGNEVQIHRDDHSGSILVQSQGDGGTATVLIGNAATTNDDIWPVTMIPTAPSIPIAPIAPSIPTIQTMPLTETQNPNTNYSQMEEVNNEVPMVIPTQMPVNNENTPEINQIEVEEEPMTVPTKTFVTYEDVGEPKPIEDQTLINGQVEPIPSSETNMNNDLQLVMETEAENSLTNYPRMENGNRIPTMKPEPKLLTDGALVETEQADKFNDVLSTTVEPIDGNEDIAKTEFTEEVDQIPITELTNSVGTRNPIISYSRGEGSNRMPIIKPVKTLTTDNTITETNQLKKMTNDPIQVRKEPFRGNKDIKTEPIEEAPQIPIIEQKKPIVTVNQESSDDVQPTIIIKAENPIESYSRGEVNDRMPMVKPTQTMITDNIAIETEQPKEVADIPTTVREEPLRGNEDIKIMPIEEIVQIPTNEQSENAIDEIQPITSIKMENPTAGNSHNENNDRMPSTKPTKLPTTDNAVIETEQPQEVTGGLIPMGNNKTGVKTGQAEKTADIPTMDQTESTPLKDNVKNAEIIDLPNNQQYGPGVVCHYQVRSLFTYNQSYIVKPEQIIMEYCDTLLVNYAILDVQTNTIQAISIEEEGVFLQLTQRKSVFNKIILELEAVTSYSFIESLLTSPENIRVFAESTVLYLLSFGFDGLQLPALFPDNEADWDADYSYIRNGYLSLVQELRMVFAEYELYLSVALPRQPDFINMGYDVAQMSYYVDWFQLISLDYNNNTPTGELRHTSPLTPQTLDDTAYIDYSLNFLLRELQIPPYLLVIALPLYGSSFVLQDSTQKYFGAPYIDYGPPGPGAYMTGVLTISELCSMMYTNWLSDPSIVTDYEDVPELVLKTLHAKVRQLAGVGIMSISMDDANGTLCNLGRMPFTAAIYKAFNANNMAYYQNTLLMLANYIDPVTTNKFMD